MRAPEFRPLTVEEFAGVAWIEKLIRPLNQFLGSVRQALGNGLTFSENFNAEIKTLEVKASDDWQTPAFLNSWTNVGGAYETAALRKTPGLVTVRGEVKSGTVGAYVFNWPAGYAPAASSYRVNHSSPATFAVLALDATGLLVSTGGNTHVSLSCSFVPADPAPAPNVSTKFTTTVRGKVLGVVPLRVVQIDGHAEKPLHAPVSADWSQDANSLIITGVTGLAAGKSYRLTLLIVGG